MIGPIARFVLPQVVVTNQDYVSDPRKALNKRPTDILPVDPFDVRPGDESNWAFQLADPECLIFCEMSVTSNGHHHLECLVAKSDDDNIAMQYVFHRRKATSNGTTTYEYRCEVVRVVEKTQNGIERRLETIDTNFDGIADGVEGTVDRVQKLVNLSNLSQTVLQGAEWIQLIDNPYNEKGKYDGFSDDGEVSYPAHLRKKSQDIDVGVYLPALKVPSRK